MNRSLSDVPTVIATYYMMRVPDSREQAFRCCLNRFLSYGSGSYKWRKLMRVELTRNAKRRTPVLKTGPCTGRI